MIPVSTLYDEYIDRPKLTEQKHPPPSRKGRKTHSCTLLCVFVLKTDILNYEKFTLFVLVMFELSLLSKRRRGKGSTKTNKGKPFCFSCSIFFNFVIMATSYSSSSSYKLPRERKWKKTATKQELDISSLSKQLSFYISAK